MRSPQRQTPSAGGGCHHWASMSSVSGRCNPELCQLSPGNESVFIPMPRLVIAANHFPQLVSTETCVSSPAGRQPFAEQSLGQGIIFGLPVLTDVEDFLQRMDTLASATQFGARVVPARDLSEDLSGFGI